MDMRRAGLFAHLRLPAPGRALCVLLTGIFVLGLTLQPAPAGQCQLALLLAIDVSGSVEYGEYLVQTEGTAAALQYPEIPATWVSARPCLVKTDMSGEPPRGCYRNRR